MQYKILLLKLNFSIFFLIEFYALISRRNFEPTSAILHFVIVFHTIYLNYYLIFQSLCN